ncbi:MAG: hypothetical protein QNJ97_03700 [Myxococcota bacterium]|nr:hypothetical protein [Myxococcota bacterium]
MVLLPHGIEVVVRPVMAQASVSPAIKRPSRSIIGGRGKPYTVFPSKIDKIGAAASVMRLHGVLNVTDENKQ